MIFPESSITGDIVSKISTRLPSLRWRTVSKWSTCSPRRIRSRISTSSFRRLGGIRILIDLPTISLARYPNRRSAALLQAVIVPSRSLLMIASSLDSCCACDDRVLVAGPWHLHVRDQACRLREYPRREEMLRRCESNGVVSQRFDKLAYAVAGQRIIIDN